ncbi:RHS repeat protein, partial [Streptomyces sp. NPDC051162]
MRELTSGTRRFDVDRTGRVTAVNAHGWKETYAYDAAGNLTYAKAPAHEAPGARDVEGTVISRAGRTTYEHDAQGRLIRRCRKLLSGRTRTWTFEWDAEDRLRATVTPEGERWEYGYDALGRRISKRCGSDETLFSWDGTRLSEQAAPGDEITTWDHTPGTHRPLTQTTRVLRAPSLSAIDNFTEDRAPAFHAIVTDAVGTPTELVTATGELAWQQRTSLW